ncbi:hypothetical protein ACFL1X_02640 [Candidatus Hydrogenedentota bacterium]
MKRILCIVLVVQLTSVVTGCSTATRIGSRISRQHTSAESADLIRKLARRPYGNPLIYQYLNTSPDFAGFVERICGKLDRVRTGYDAAKFVSGLSLERKGRDLLPNTGVDLSECPGWARAGVARLVSGMALSHNLLEEAFARLGPEDISFVCKSLLIVPPSNDESYNEDERKKLEKLRKKCYELADKIDQAGIEAAGLALVETASEVWKDLRKSYSRADISELPGRLDIATPWGDIRLSFKGDDSYSSENSPSVIVDFEGDDLYQNVPEGFGLARPLALVIDLDGNDRYECPERAGPVLAILGLSVLLDGQGDDLYRGGLFSMGSATGGFAALMDWAGDDTYDCGAYSLGFGFFGTGLLFDREGNDRYEVTHMGQGVGHVKGKGALIDVKGSDVYTAGGLVPDVLRDPERFISLSQGYGVGHRPDFSGGIGILADLGGDDSYKCDVFGQGGGLWLSMGILYDASGDDRYQAHRYAQGAGIHFSLGALVDGAGSDSYSSWGVSMGCGHDYALGLLLDESGNDSYESSWLSQGAGSENGVGVHWDTDGHDQYLDGGDTQSSGYAHTAESIGILGRAGRRAAQD